MQPLIKRGWELPEDPSPQDAPPSLASPLENQNNLFLRGLVL